MHVNNILFRELIKKGYSLDGRKRVWDISDSKLLYITPELAKGFLNLKRKFAPLHARIVGDETALLTSHFPRVLQEFGDKNFNLIDLGCGDGEKAEILFRLMPKDFRVRYCPIDINSHFIKMAKERVKKVSKEGLSSVKPVQADFKKEPYILGMFRSNDFQRNITLLLGETISHYDIHELLYKLSQDLFPGDLLVIGNGIRTGKRFVDLEKYKHPLFNSWFINVVKGVGFNENEVKIGVRFAHGRLEAFYHVLVDKIVANKGRSVHFQKGDEIVVAIQYKYFENELRKFCKMYFSDVQLHKSQNDEYALVVCKK